MRLDSEREFVVSGNEQIAERARPPQPTPPRSPRRSPCQAYCGEDRGAASGALTPVGPIAGHLRVSCDQLLYSLTRTRTAKGAVNWVVTSAPGARRTSWPFVASTTPVPAAPPTAAPCAAPFFPPTIPPTTHPRRRCASSLLQPHHERDPAIEPPHLFVRVGVLRALPHRSWPSR